MSLFKVRRHVIYSLYNTGPVEPHVCLHECGCSTWTHFVLQSSVSAAVHWLFFFFFLREDFGFTHLHWLLCCSSSPTSLPSKSISGYLLVRYVQPAAAVLDTNTATRCLFTIKYLHNVTMNVFVHWVCWFIWQISCLTVKHWLHLLSRYQWNSRL